jgi:hypothetical protein
VACALAVLIRPNLAPLALVPLLLAKQRLVFAAPVAVAGVFLAVLQWLWYGSPLRSGYGTAGELFSMANIVPNVRQYATWLVATSPMLYLAPLGFARVRREGHARALFVFSLMVIVAYLVYGVFEHWSYLRFLLPAMAVFAVFAAIALQAWIDRWPAPWRLPLFLAIALAVSTYGLFVAREFDTFTLADQFRRVAQVASFVNDNAPSGAVIISGEQSGSMRYYTGRSILRWEAATPDTLRDAIEMLETGGRPVYIVLDAFENELFVKKFAALPEVTIDWPPMVDAGTTHRTRLWRLADRARFLAGENLQTVRLP